MAVERPDWDWYQRAAELVAGGRLNDAEDAASEALRAGHLWRVSLLLAPALEPLRGRKRFEEIAAEARRRVEARALKPLVLTAMPAGRSVVAPLLLTLHGATSNAASELERWRPATELGWIVAAGQSSQPATGDGFCWDPPRERIVQDLRAIAAMLPQHARTVIAGFSQGAWVALNAALHGAIFQVGSLVMIAPFAGSIASLERAWRRLQVTVLVGGDDMYRADVERLVQYLKDREHHVALETIAGLAHAYPSDFAERLPSLLKP